jgi:hypothetical protein
MGSATKCKELFQKKKRNIKESNGIKYLTQGDGMPWRGGSLIGYLTADFEKLVEILGEDYVEGGDGKTQANWDVYFEDGSHATIYDWKHYSPLEGITEWNIGGEDASVVPKVLKLLGVKGQKARW